MAELTDRVVLRRWLSAVGLLDTAQALVTRGSDAESLIVSQAGAETTLSLLAGWATQPPSEQAKWDKLVLAAKASLQQAQSAFPPDLVNQLNAAHTLRNAVVHRGAVAPSNEARASISATRRLLDLLPAVAAYFKALPDGAGLAGAVAELLDAPDVSEQLRAGEDAIRAELPVDAADAAARALSMALSRTDPRLGGTDSGTEIAFLRFPGEGIDQRVVSLLAAADERLSDLEAWTLGAVLGIRPTDFARLRSITGRRVEYVDGSPGRVYRDHEPTFPDASWAVRQVAEVIYRLQETGSLIEGPPDKVWERRRERSVG